jgi:hypothetical protein
VQLKNIPFYLSHPRIFASTLIYKSRTIFQPDLPWLSYDAVKFVDTLPLKNESVFEWGSGRSTVWFAKRCRELISIENNQIWHQRVLGMLEKKRLSHVKCLHYELSESDLKVAPDSQTQPLYVTVIDSIPEKSLGLVVVDGYGLRHACIQRALPKIRKDGYLLIDNTDWIKLEDWKVPPDWPIVHRSRNAFTETTIWRCPS